MLTFLWRIYYQFNFLFTTFCSTCSFFFGKDFANAANSKLRCYLRARRVRWVLLSLRSTIRSLRARQDHGQGLRPEQVQGSGQGVLNGKALSQAHVSVCIKSCLKQRRTLRSRKGLKLWPVTI